jgi:hypothetical protein
VASALERLTLVMAAFRRRKHASKSLRRGINVCVVLTKVEEDGIELVSTRNQEVTRGRARDHVMGYCGLVSPITDTTQNAQQKKKKKKKLAKFSESSIILLDD